MMRSSTALLVLSAQLFAMGVAAHREWWLPTLPKCWQSCFANTEDGCSSSSCICQTSEDSASYLPSVISCAVSQCNADDWAVKLVLGPLELICFDMSCPIPKDVMDDAYAAASDTDNKPPQSTRTLVSATSSKMGEHKTSKGSDSVRDVTSTIRSTLTRTTTDGNGHTLQIVVPIVVGPSGIFTGAMSTSTLSGRTTSTGASSSVPAAPSPSAATSSAIQTTLQSTTSTAASQRTESPARGNGSPFENMQAGANRWVMPEPLLCLGALALLLMM